VSQNLKYYKIFFCSVTDKRWRNWKMENKSYSNAASNGASVLARCCHYRKNNFAWYVN